VPSFVNFCGAKVLEVNILYKLICCIRLIYDGKLTLCMFLSVVVVSVLLSYGTLIFFLFYHRTSLTPSSSTSAPFSPIHHLLLLQHIYLTVLLSSFSFITALLSLLRPLPVHPSPLFITFFFLLPVPLSSSLVTFFVD